MVLFGVRELDTALVLTDVARVGVTVATVEDGMRRLPMRLLPLPAHETTAALWLLLLQAPLPLERGLPAQLLSLESNDSLISAPATPTLTLPLARVIHSDVTGITRQNKQIAKPPGDRLN